MVRATGFQPVREDRASRLSADESDRLEARRPRQAGLLSSCSTRSIAHAASVAATRDFSLRGRPTGDARQGADLSLDSREVSLQIPVRLRATSGACFVPAMVANPLHHPLGRLAAALFIAASGMAGHAQNVSNTPAVPRVMVPTSSQAAAPAQPKVTVPAVSRAPDPARPQPPGPRLLYPWKTRVTCTIFWIGELPSGRNTTPNTRSSWDAQWSANFGGYDDPEPANRIASHATGEFRPKGFVPKLNPFYVALPYNDVATSGGHKPEAARAIPWFSRVNPEPGKTVCKGRWLQIFRGGRSCFGQWEDVGPWETDDWEFVFGTKPPKTTQNGAAGIDLSPAIRDYLGLKSGDKVHWRFVEASQVPYGPWKKYGQETATSSDPDLAAQQRYIENLRKLRDEQFLKKPLSQLQN